MANNIKNINDYGLSLMTVGEDEGGLTCLHASCATCKLMAQRQGTLRQHDKRLQLATNPRDRQFTRRRIVRYRNGKTNLHRTNTRRETAWRATVQPSKTSSRKVPSWSLVGPRRSPLPSTFGDRVALRKSTQRPPRAEKLRKNQGAYDPASGRYAPRWKGEPRKSTPGRYSSLSPCAWRSSWWGTMRTWSAMPS